MQLWLPLTPRRSTGGEKPFQNATFLFFHCLPLKPPVIAAEHLQVCFSEDRRGNKMFPPKVRLHSSTVRQMSISACFAPLIRSSGWSPHKVGLSLGCLSSRNVFDRQRGSHRAACRRHVATKGLYTSIRRMLEDCTVICRRSRSVSRTDETSDNVHVL